MPKRRPRRAAKLDAASWCVVVAPVMLVPIQAPTLAGAHGRPKAVRLQPEAEPRSDLFRGVSPDAGPAAIAADGRIVVEVPSPESPASRQLLRLRANGSVDETWLQPTDAASLLFAEPDGRVLSVGAHQVIDFGFVSSLYGVLRRFDADGKPDVAFGSGGETGLPLLDGAATFAVGAAVQRDGRIVVGCVRGGGGWLLARFVQ